MVTAFAVPMIFAILGITLIAAAAFGPRKGVAHAAVSFAPPTAPPERARWPRPVGWFPPRPAPTIATPSASAPRSAQWPETLDPHAAGCSVATRLALVDALAALRTPWANDILRDALIDDHEPTVRDAVLRALSA